MATESAEGVFGLSSYRNAPMRLQALMWGVDDLAADLGAFSAHAGRELTAPFSVARTMCLLAAAQAGIDAIDAVSTTLTDPSHISEEMNVGRRVSITDPCAGNGTVSTQPPFASPLPPPKTEDGGQEDVGPSAAAERAASYVDEAMEPIAAYEEWNAAREFEWMKGEAH